MKRIIPIAGILTMALMAQGCGSSAPAPAVSTKQVFISFSTNATPVTLSGVDLDVYLPNNVTVPLQGGSSNEVSVTAFSTTNTANAALRIFGSYSAFPTMQKVHITAVDISDPPADLRYGKFLTFTCTYATSLLASDITSLNPAGSLNFSGVYGSPQQDITTILSEPILSISITN